MSRTEKTDARLVWERVIESSQEILQLIPAFLHAFQARCDHSVTIAHEMSLEMTFLADIATLARKEGLLHHGRASQCKHPRGDTQITTKEPLDPSGKEEVEEGEEEKSH